MATITNAPISSSLFAKSTSGGGKTFLTSESASPVQQLVQAQKAQISAKTNYFDSEDFLRMKAFEIRARIVLYQNLGLSQEYQAAQAEGAEVVKKYQAILAKQSAQAAAKQVQDQINSAISA